MSKKLWSKKVTLCVITGDKKMNDMMSSFDQTDGGRKVFATPQFYSVTLTNVRTRKYIIDHLMQNIKAARIPCAAVFFTDSTEPCYIDQTIRTVSDGSKWFVLTEFIYAQWNANGLGSKKNERS